jgi:hypothetical protein
MVDRIVDHVQIDAFRQFVPIHHLTEQCIPIQLPPPSTRQMDAIYNAIYKTHYFH